MAEELKNKSTPDEIDCRSLFIDSGAFSQRKKSVQWSKEKYGSDKNWREFYDTQEFWDYADAYVAFIKEHEDSIDLYANIDVISDPELTWRNQLYLESKGIRPVPVVHNGKASRIIHYIERGYNLIGLGGLVATGGFGTQQSAKTFLDNVFRIICDNKERLPIVRTHGFGLAGPLAARYPFWSVDSTRWVMPGSFGNILVPLFNQKTGEPLFDEEPLILPCTYESPFLKKGIDRHLFTLRPSLRKRVDDWLASIGVEVGEGPTENRIKRGICNVRKLRIRETLLYYDQMRRHLPPFPFPFRPTLSRPNNGMNHEREERGKKVELSSKLKKMRAANDDPTETMRFYFSSQQYEYPADPEVVVQPADVMTSYFYNSEKIHPRIKALMKHRRMKKRAERKEAQRCRRKS